MGHAALLSTENRIHPLCTDIVDEWSSGCHSEVERQWNQNQFYETMSTSKMWKYNNSVQNCGHRHEFCCIWKYFRMHCIATNEIANLCTTRREGDLNIISRTASPTATYTLKSKRTRLIYWTTHVQCTMHNAQQFILSKCTETNT